ncbi:MAG: hypothetical protein U0R24_08970 [Solirubrobacterales bacterium]
MSRMRAARGRTTLSNALSLVAVFIALGATAYAAGLAKNSVKSKQIKDGAIQGRDIRDGAVTGGKAGEGSLAGADFAADALSGADVDEGTLRGVRATSTARVGGLQVKKIDFQVGTTNTVTNVLEFPGVFRIDALCANFGDVLDINAATGVDNATISVVGSFAASGNEEDAFRNLSSAIDDDFDKSETFSIDGNLPSVGSRQHASIQFSTPAGFVATVDIATEELGPSCKVTGFAIGG